MKTVTVELGARTYPIHIEAGILARAGEFLAPLAKGRRVAIVTDENLSVHLATLQASLTAAGVASEAIVLAPGEGSKSWSTLEMLCDRLLELGVERGDHVVALGGGVMGDLVGFACSILKRGCNFVQIPTSLLAQVDSSVGGKTGINSPHGKNLIGAFHQPVLVLADLSTLDTLDRRQFAAGYAEVVKYGLIDDEEFFFWLEANQAEIFAGGPARGEAIARCCAHKARVVIEDEKELGVRALLNLGHTFGHALEKDTGYSDRLLHGEGVAIGMVLAHGFSAQLGLAPGQDTGRVVAHLKTAGLPTTLADVPGTLGSTAVLMDAIAQDKKVSRGALTFILTRGIGRAFIQKNVDAAIVADFIETMRTH